MKISNRFGPWPQTSGSGSCISGIGLSLSSDLNLLIDNQMRCQYLLGMENAMSSESAAAPGRRRYSPAERRQMILDGAIQFFAEHGLDGSTHALAKYLNVTQPLIYQYFPNKEELIDAVYEELFRGRWQAEFDTILTDRSRPLRDRLIDFYARYATIMHSSEWMRVYLYSGLRNLQLNQRYNPLVEKGVIARFCEELRHSLGLPGFDAVPLTPQEREATWILHGGLFYYGVRRFIYRVEACTETALAVDAAVTMYLGGMPDVYRRLGLLPG
ncbi:MAG TPA: TetR family transcriptional regulator [Gemmobacter sp.]|nr:TetR family transcriptional regulator [Gemmobacter sp.]